MGAVEFKKADLRSLVSDEECEALEKVDIRFSGKRRWSLNYVLVFKDKATGKFYEVHYSEGATEQQDESPFEYEPDLIRCEEVVPVEKTVIVYERLPASA